MAHSLRHPCLSTDIYGILSRFLGEPEQRHGEADSTNGCKDKWKNVDAWESHRQWKRMKERVQHVDCSLTMGNMVGFISSHASNHQIAYSYSPRNSTGCDAILCHIMLDWYCLWMSQPHWGRTIPKGDFCLVRNKRLRSVDLCLWAEAKPKVPFSIPGSLRGRRGQCPGSALLDRPVESWRGSRPQPQKHSIVPGGTRNSHLSQHGLARSGSPTRHKYLHDMCWHARSYHKSFKLIIAH